jgi:hypothetical protein
MSTGSGMMDCTVDTDQDGITDCDEAKCGSSPTNGMEKCYKCGWKHNDPGNLVSDGSSVGNVVANVKMTDKCGEQVKLWDFAQEYHIIFMTASW